MGPKTKIKMGGKKFDEQKYERKIRASGDKLFTHQFQTAERILAPDWAEKFFSLGDVFPIMAYTVGGSARQEYLFQAGSIEKGRDFTN